MIESWNQEFTSMRITASYGAGSLEKGEALDVGDGPERGDELIQQLELVRSQCLPPEVWPLEVVGFSSRWQSFKAAHAAVDFTDLIDLAPDDPPQNLSALLVDEFQDHSQLETRKLRTWAQQIKTFVVVGDPYQSLYAWRGADPDAFTGKPHHVLGQSWRVSRLVQEKALDIIRRSGDWRDDIEYRPRDEDGQVDATFATWKRPEPLLSMIESLREDESVMILASCDYQLNPLKAMLRNAGIVYCNPYTHRWNPLGGKAVAKMMAMLRFCAHRWGGPDETEFVWTAEEVRQWAPLFLSAPNIDSDEGAFIRGAKKALEEIPEGVQPDVVRAFIREKLSRRATRALIEGDMPWIRANLTKAAGSALEYPMAILEKRGWCALNQESRVIIGTIHSVKGGEASHVVVFPDLSPSGYRQFQQPGWRTRDAIYRMFYVALTRARSSVTLARPVSAAGGAIRW
jgi:superfamily I DNA/RNA helicase